MYPHMAAVCVGEGTEKLALWPNKPLLDFLILESLQQLWSPDDLLKFS